MSVQAMVSTCCWNREVIQGATSTTNWLGTICDPAGLLALATPFCPTMPPI